MGRVTPPKRYEGWWMRLQEKENIPDTNEHQVKTITEICVSLGTRTKVHNSKPLEGAIPKSRRCQQRYTRKREKEKQRAPKVH